MAADLCDISAPFTLKATVRASVRKANTSIDVVAGAPDEETGKIKINWIVKKP